MTNSKTMKRALLTSIIALVVCFSMLVGTTFAWFTDSVTSSGNIIQSGTLEVTMSWAKGDEAVPTDDAGWTNAESGPIFNYTKWEPGYVEARHIQIKNVGTLALRYKLVITPNGTVDELADVIDVYFAKDATQVNRTTFANATPVGTLRDLINDPDGAAHGALLPKDTNATPTSYEEIGQVTSTIAFKMREEVGNEYQGMSIGTNFDIKLIATQYTFESDSIDNMYDDAAWVIANADSVVNNANELDAALANGGLVALASDINGNVTLDNVAEGTMLNFAGNNINGTVTVAEGQEVTINGQGGINATGSNPAVKVGKETDVTISGGTLTSESGSAIAIANTKTEVPMSLTINEGTTVTAPTLISLDVSNGYAGASVEINGGDFTATKSGSYVSPINVGGADVTINGGNFEAPNATSYCYFVDVGEKYNTETATYDVGSVVINGGTFKSNANYGRVVYGSISNYNNRVAGEVIINGGTFEMMGTYGVLTDVGAHVVVNDCTFVSGGSAVFSITNNNTTDRTIEVKGGNYTITTRMSYWSIPLGSFAGSYPTDTAPVGKVIISGGTINNYICDGSVIGGSTSVDLVADGYHVVDNNNGTWSVVAD